MKYRWCSAVVPFLLLFLISGTFSSTIKDNIYALCEEYFECEAIAKLQDRLCVGNALNPYWLPTAFKADEHCHQKLKNDYIHLDRLEREIRNKKLECVNETLYKLEDYQIVEAQDGSCPLSLLETSKKFRNPDGTIIVNQCFLGSRISKQCGALRECCNGIKKCESSIAKTVIAEERTARARTIYKKARDCQSGLNVSELKLEEVPLAEEVSSKNRTSAPSTTESATIFPQAITTSLSNIANDRAMFTDSTKVTAGDVQSTVINQTEMTVQGLKVENIEGSGMDMDVKSIPDVKENTLNGVTTKTEANRVMDSDDILDKGLIIIKFHTPNETDDAAVAMKDTESKEIISAVTEDKKTPVKDYNSKAYQKAIVGMNHQQQPLSDDEMNRAEAMRKKIEHDFKQFNEAYENFERISSKNKTVESHSLASNETLANQSQTTYNCSNYEEPDQDTRKGILQALLKMIQKLYAAAKRLMEKEGASADGNDSLSAEYDKLKSAGVQLPCTSKLTSSGNFEKGEELVDHRSSNVISAVKPYDMPLSHPRAIKGSSLKQEIFTNDAVDDIAQFKANKNVSNCDKYLTCRHQLFRQLDRCSMLAVRRNRAFAISTESLLQLGGQCNLTNSNEYIELMQRNTESTRRLRKCLENGNETDYKPECLAGINIFNSELLKTVQENVYSTERDCYADVNSLQLACAGLRSCCPSFHRCREETSSATDENVILELTSKLATENQSCLERNLMSGMTVSQQSDSDNAAFFSRMMRDSIVL